MSIDIREERLVTVAELAAHLSLSKPHTWRLVLRGDIDSVKLGKGLRSPRRTSVEAGQRYIQRINQRVED